MLDAYVIKMKDFQFFLSCIHGPGCMRRPACIVYFQFFLSCIVTAVTSSGDALLYNFQFFLSCIPTSITLPLRIIAIDDFQFFLSCIETVHPWQIYAWSAVLSILSELHLIANARPQTRPLSSFQFFLSCINPVHCNIFSHEFYFFQFFLSCITIEVRGVVRGYSVLSILSELHPKETLAYS